MMSSTMEATSKIEQPCCDITVAVVTQHRPSELTDCIVSLWQQKFFLNGALINNFLIHIIDNSSTSPVPTATVETLVKNPRVRYFYLGEDKIVRARNFAMEKCSTRYLAFIDDDCVASEGWLNELVRVLLLTKAEVVFGPTYPEYKVSEDNRVKKSRLLEPKLAPDGAPNSFLESTSNVLLDLVPIRSANMQFDSRFSDSGGSDTFFFSGLRALGFALVFSPKAKVYEKFTERRLNFRWISRRAIRCGGVLACTQNTYSLSNYASLIIFAIQTLLKSFVPSSSNLVNRVWNVCFSLGVLLFALKGKVLNEYDRTKGKFSDFGVPRVGLFSILKRRWLHFRGGAVIE